ncbi:MAG: PorV/PorQ family protein [Candidatus Latescibacterota bacterium]
MRFIRCILLAAVALTATGAYAQNDNAGTTGFSFLKVGVGARAAALGGAYTAISGDLESTAWNPAGIYDVGERAAAVSLTSYLVDTEAGFLCVALPSGSRMWAVSVNYFTYGDLQRTSEDGLATGTFGAFDVTTGLTAAQRVWGDRLTLGATAKWIYSGIDDFSADAMAVDLGVLARGPIPGMTVGASMSNFGTVRSGFTKGYEDSLPVLLRAGVSHRPAHFPVPVLLSGDITIPNDNDAYFTFGAEIRLAGGLTLRPGHSLQQSGLDGDEALGLSTGAGLDLKGMRFDYAYASFPALGDVHRVSLSGRI